VFSCGQHFLDSEASISPGGNYLRKHSQNYSEPFLEVAALQQNEKTAQPKQNKTFLRNFNQGM